MGNKKENLSFTGTNFDKWKEIKSNKIWSVSLVSETVILKLR